MQGLSFIHTGFLLAGLTALIPIIIHLLFRQRTRTVPIGSIRFLLPVVREHRRRRRVKQWILLALRMLALLALTLLFCRPYLDRSHLLGLEKEVVILVDRSASMQALDSKGESSFSRALEQTQKEVSQLDENTIVHVATFDSTGVQELPYEQLPTVETTEAATDFGLAFSWAVDILAASKRITKKIVLVTDMQQSGLTRTPLNRIPDGLGLVVHDVGDPLPRNVAIESADPIRTEIRPDSQVSIRVTIRNHSPIPVRNLRASCEVTHLQTDKHFTQENQIDVSGLGRTTIEFSLPLETDGLYQGKVSIATDDALKIDNTRWIAFEARHPDRVLLVDGQEGRSVFSNETYYLETALRLQLTDPAGPTRSFETERIAWEAGKGFPRLDGYRVIVLANVRRLSSDDGERMASYLRQGGSLLVFAGDQVSSNSLHELKIAGLLPGNVAESPIDGRMRVTQWNAKHPALECFNDPQQGDLRRIEFRTVLPIHSLTPDSKTLLNSGNTIIAAERQIEKGRCVYFGISADRDWTPLPQSPMYVPLMRQLLAYLTDQLSERSAVTHQLVSKPGEKTGITPNEKNQGFWLVTNVDPHESELQRMAVDDFQTMAGTEAQDSTKSASALAGLKLPSDSIREDEIWTIVAWFLFAILAAEMLLAGRVHG